MRQPLSHLWSEEEYFHQLDNELIESMRRRAAFRERRLRLAEASHVYEPAVLEALEKLGYDHTTATLLFIVPLVQVAWADGSVSHAERDHILALAGLRGVKANTPAHERLTAWLERRPPDDFFEGTLKAIGAVLASLASADRKASKEALLLWCRDTAATPCHVFGWMSRVCAAKRRAIEEIGRSLELSQAA